VKIFSGKISGFSGKISGFSGKISGFSGKISGAGKISGDLFLYSYSLFYNLPENETIKYKISKKKIYIISENTGKISGKL